MVKEISLELNNLDNQARSARTKSVDYEAVLQAIKEYPANSLRRISVELCLLHSSVVRHLYDLNKSTLSCRIGIM